LCLFTAHLKQQSRDILPPPSAAGTAAKNETSEFLSGSIEANPLAEAHDPCMQCR
jgi:hypothetical protein